MNQEKFKNIINNLQHQLKKTKQEMNNKIVLLTRKNENIKQEMNNKIVLLTRENENIKRENENIKINDNATIQYMEQNNIQYKKAGPFILLS